jgi:Maltokinase N-terminal cap domain
MGVIYTATTLTPSKEELLTTWLPTQPWYVWPGREPELTKVGGFRVDDPANEVGIEFMAVTDGSGDQAITYHAALTYRGGPCQDTAAELIGTTEHGVLGRRWAYDGTRDLVLITQLVALSRRCARPGPEQEPHAGSDGHQPAGDGRAPDSRGLGSGR